MTNRTTQINLFVVVRFDLVRLRGLGERGRGERERCRDRDLLRDLVRDLDLVRALKLNTKFI